ncbi:MAG: TIGR02302 family protein [Pseudomonadota bacterium]
MPDIDALRDATHRLTWPVRFTHLGLIAERVVHAFWPLVSVILAALALAMLGVQDSVAVEVVWFAVVLSALGAIGALVWGVRVFHWPTRAEAVDRLDRTLKGRPIAAVTDAQAIGRGDEASETVWKAHVTRMTDRLADARAVKPNLRVASRDPYALRYVAVVAFVVALLFGSILRVGTVADLGAAQGDTLAAGPAWEGWVEPPAYTGRPSLYLNDIPAGELSVPQGSAITLRLYGEIGDLLITETVSGETTDISAASDPAQSFTVTQSGTIAVEGPGGATWSVTVLEDLAPEIALVGSLEATAGGEFRQSFRASDDYGVIAGRVEITLDLARIDRRYGLAIEPEPREPVILDLPMTISGDRSEFDETLVGELAQHPWATLPVTARAMVEDAIGQTGVAIDASAVLPGKRFFDPLAASVAEQRRDLLWNRTNAGRVSDVLRAVSYEPEDIFRSETTYLKLRVLIRRLEAATELGVLTDETRDEIAQALWDIAVEIEEGDLSDALERLRRAQERLSEAIENGATDEEIAELMQELREAMQDYMRQLAERAGEEGEPQAQSENMESITGDQLEQMLQELQDLMEQGRMAEAQRLLDQLRQMMENMQITQGQPGQNGQQSQGQQAMEGLAETLREQQGLSDEAFRDLQDQFNPGQQQQGQQGQQQGQNQQGQQPGQLPGQNQGQGQQPGTQQGQNGQGQLPQPGQPGGGQGQQSLADRQQALRNELGRQQQNLPGAGTQEGQAAREALDRAGRAMDDAEEALRDEDFAGALDNQAEAMEALRDGMRALGEQLAQQQQQNGQQGEAVGEADPMGRRDPLGREPGQNGAIGTEEELLQGEDVYRRARELLDTIRERSADQSRPEEELDYLKRLLERF